MADVSILPTPLSRALRQALSAALGICCAATTVSAGGLPKLPAALTAAPDGIVLPPYMFEELLADGRTVPHDFAERRGTPVLVALWATWCGVCATELPKLDQLAAEIGNEVPVLALSIDEAGLETAAAYLRKRGLAHLRPYHDTEQITFALLGATGVPTVYVADAEGRVLARSSGPVDWNGAEVRNYLRALASSAGSDDSLDRPGAQQH